MRRTIAAVAAALMLAGCGAREPAVEGAWIRLPAVPGRPAAAYFRLRAGDAPLTLLSVRTPAALTTELHETRRNGRGVTSMNRVGQVDVPARGTMALAPGGLHVMMFDVNPTLKPGGETTVTLDFADGATLQAPAALRGAGDPAP